MLAACRLLGDRGVRPLLWPIVGYFLLTSAAARRASHDFHRRIGRNGGWGDYYRQLMNFAQSLVDRIFLLSGRLGAYSIRPSGRELLLECARQRRGAIILSAHFGSFEAGRALMRQQHEVDVHFVAWHSASPKIRGVLDELDPSLHRLLIDPTTPDAIFRMREVVENGGLLAILGDRTAFGQKSVALDFLGEKVAFPAGPWLLAAALDCPIFLFLGLRTGSHTYEPQVELLAERIELAGGLRDPRLAGHMQRYADRLAHFARRHPENWFNFYDFWQWEQQV